jgi:hypothetical protein
MKFKTGDKVKFLNDVGGGIISKIVSPTMVNVMVEDGFDIPVLISELVLAESSDPKESVFNQDFPSANIDPKHIEIENEIPERISKLQKFSSLNNKPSGIYLAYIPQDQVWLLKDDIDIFLINHTSFEILYTLACKTEENTFIGIDYGSIDPSSKIHITTTSREELIQWLEGFVQVLFFKEDNQKIMMPLHAPFKVKPVRFTKKDAYTASNLMEEKGILSYLGHPVSMGESTFDLLEKDTEAMQKQYIQTPQKEEKFIDKYKIDKNTAEVDLHIESIVDDHSKLNNAQILDKQTGLFIKCLESAIEEKLQKVIFIHGVGNGVLKNEIHSTLKQYPNVHYFDASMQKYGCGATEVLIKHSLPLD